MGNAARREMAPANWYGRRRQASLEAQEAQRAHGLTGHYSSNCHFAPAAAWRTRTSTSTCGIWNLRGRVWILDSCTNHSQCVSILYSNYLSVLASADAHERCPWYCAVSTVWPNGHLFDRRGSSSVKAQSQRAQGDVCSSWSCAWAKPTQLARLWPLTSMRLGLAR